ncbi:GDP-mannose 4,6-dehydratase [Bacteroidales bacterium Barb7]|nr:GDP-mannose 4,6-dehydratase [Bacteroidales bacterium Barb7]
MKKYLITGSSGFVGNYFIHFLENNQIKSSVLGLDIFETIKQNIDYKYVNWSFRKIDLLNTTEIENIVYSFQPDYILHLASYSSVAFSWKNPVLSFQNNTNIFLNLVEAVRKLNLTTRVLSIGSSEEYGNINIEHLPLHEDLPVDPISPYAVARVSQELLSKVYSEGYGIDIVLTRSFNHLGPYQKDVFVVSSFAKQIAELKNQKKKDGRIITGDLAIVRDFLDVRDVVRAYYLLLTDGIRGNIYNVCSGNGISLSEVIEKLSQISGIKIDPKINSRFIRPNDNKVIIGSNKKICETTGWLPEISINKSLEDIYNYWLNIV